MLAFDEPRILTAPHFKDPDGPAKHWRKEIEFDLSTGERVTGFVAIREKGSTREAGLSLYRRHRLIVGSDDESYRPPEIFGGSNSYTYQRVFGELQLDDFDVSPTKDSFRWEDREQEFLKTLRKKTDAAPLPIVQQAEGYRARRATPDMGVAAGKAATKTARVLPEAQTVIERQASVPAKEVEHPSGYGATAVSNTQELILVIKGQEWRVSIETTTDPAATEWVKIRESKKAGKARELGILFSISHPFTQQFGGATAEDIEGLVRVAVGLAIAETTAREAGVNMAGVVLRHLNELLGGVLARQ